MKAGAGRFDILVGLLNTLYEEFKDDLPSLVRLPVHVALAVAQQASPEERQQLKAATEQDIQAALDSSQLAVAYAQAGQQKAEAIGDAVRYLHLVCQEGMEALRADQAAVHEITWTTLQELRRFLSEYRGRGELAKPFTLTPPRNLPARNPKFAGRTRELAEVHERLTRQREVGVTQQTAAFGHGGVGKTSIAGEYAWSHLEHYPGGVFFLLCDTELLTPAIAELAPYLGIEEADKQDQTALAVKRKLEEPGRALLILDNVRGAEQWADRAWRESLPVENCCLLATTRAGHLPGVEMYLIERLSRPEGIQLLGKHRVDAAAPENE